jgi:hypothetical protein
MFLSRLCKSPITLPWGVARDIANDNSTLLHNATGPTQWVPVSNLTRTDADVTIVFIAPNSIKFRTKVEDPIFQATYPDTELSNTGERFTVYTPDYQVSVVGCTEQYSICNPNLQSNSCTPQSGQNSLPTLIRSLNFNSAQLVTAYRMIYMIADGTTYSSVNGIGPDALQIWNKVYDFVAPGVPENQWQIEVEGWLETTLAKWQAYVVEYASNTADLGHHGHVGFPVSNNTLQTEWRNQCKNQKISNVGAYQNVTVFGFAFTWATGGVLIIFSWCLAWCVKKQRKWGKRAGKAGPTARRIAWNIDGKFQQQRVALRTVEYQGLVGGEGDVPFLEEEGPLPLPFNAYEEKVKGRKEADTIYIRAAAASGTVGHHAEDIDLLQIAPNGITEAAGATMTAYPPPLPPPPPPVLAENEGVSQDAGGPSQRRRSRISLNGSQPSLSQHSSTDLTIRGSLPSPPQSRGSPNSTTTPNEATDNNPHRSPNPAHQDDSAVVQQPTREHGSIEVSHVANADAPPHLPPIPSPLTTKIEPDQRQGSSHHPHT